MVLTKEEKVELLKKARQAKADKRAAALKEKEVAYVEQVEKGEYKQDNQDLEEIIKPKKSRSKKQQEQPQETKTLELTLPEKEEIEVNETIKVKAPKKKKVIKRVVEVEESDTEEEVIEEVVRVPRKQKDVATSRKVMLDKLVEQNRMKLMNELFP